MLTYISEGLTKFAFKEECHFYPEDGYDKFLQDTSNQLQDYTIY